MDARSPADEASPASGGSSAPPSRSRSRIAEVVFGASSSVWSEEVRALLERRLKVILLTTDVLFGAFLVNLFVVSGSPPLGVQALAFGAAALAEAGATAALLVQRSPSLRRLRAIEAVGLGAMLVVWCVWTYGWLTHGIAVGAWPAPADAEAALHDQAWVLSSDASGTVLHVRSGVPLLGARMALNWGLVAVAYGTIVPNTWRRAAAVMASMVVLPLGTVVVAGIVNPALRPMVGGLLFGGTYVLLGFAGLGLYGCHKLDVARRAAFDARHVGQYRLVRELGHGGMGQVYLAEHRHLRRPCAVKLIREQGTTHGRLARFEREVQATARLTHPNTIEVYDFGRTDAGTFFYAMEYLPGMTLEELVERHGALPAGRVIYLLRQACGALAEAHALGLIHRDVKPANLFVCDRGGLRDFVKILDFGIVQERRVGALPAAPPGASSVASSPAAMVDGPGDSRLTRDGAILGTPAYVSPEQVQGEEVDARCDVYALGAVAFFLLTGGPPFTGKTLLDVCMAHLWTTPPRPSQRTPGVPAGLDAVVLRCLAKLPRERFQSVRELDAALAACEAAGSWDGERATAWWAEHGELAAKASDTPGGGAAELAHGETIAAGP